MADSAKDENKGLYLHAGEWVAFAFLFCAQALALPTAWILDLAAFNSTLKKNTAEAKRIKWIVLNKESDNEQFAQEHLFSMLTKSCGHVVWNMDLLMQEEYSKADSGR